MIPCAPGGLLRKPPLKCAGTQHAQISYARYVPAHWTSFNTPYCGRIMRGDLACGHMTHIMCVSSCVGAPYSTLFGAVSPFILKEFHKKLQFLAIFLNSTILRYFGQKHRKTRVFLDFSKKMLIFVQIAFHNVCHLVYAHCHTANACASTAMRRPHYVGQHVCEPTGGPTCR